MAQTLETFFLPAFIFSLITSVVILLTKRLHGRYTFDAAPGVQKVHFDPTPRIGGVAVLIGMLVALWSIPQYGNLKSIGMFMAMASLPTFAVGLWEDIRGTVKPWVRLLSHIISAFVLVLGGGYILRATGFELTDRIMQFTPVAVLISVFAVSGMTNAVNIIDGYNGLASGTVIIMAIGLGLTAIRLGDTEVFLLCLILSGSVLGFFMVNFPFGKVFFGDAGAYYCGFIICGLVLILTVRHPGVSPWVPLLVIIYPVWEVKVSILRRLRRAGHRPSQADKVHLHHLLSRSLARPVSRRLGWRRGQNPITGMLLWPLPLLTTLIAINVEMSSTNALLGIVVFYAFYDRLYKKLSFQV
jgi:UDP-N-acetylmuramyl pentapeptide phosphotransferase/UDP-N-acetylglucosamine-1-phosphate transferase